MRILYCHYLTDARHPAAQMVEHIASNLRELGHNVEVHASAVCDNRSSSANSNLQENEHVSQDSKCITAMAKRALWFAKAMSRNRGWYQRDRIAIAEFQPDVVISRQDAYSWSAAKAAVKAKVPLVTYADAPVAYETRLFNPERRWHPPGIVEHIERWGLSKSEAIITVSHPAEKRLKNYRISTPIHINHNGISTDRFPLRSTEEREAIKSRLSVSGKTVLGFQGTFKPFHGIDRLRDIMLWSAQHDVAWVLIGDGPERASIENATRGHVPAVFLGRRAPEEMSELLSAIDIAVAPHSQMDGDFYFCPLKILEYAASGCAVVASEQGDIPLLLANGTGGAIVPDDRLSSWTSACDRLIKDPDHRKETALRGRQHVIKNLSWKDTAFRVARVLDQVFEDQQKQRSKRVPSSGVLTKSAVRTPGVPMR